MKKESRFPAFTAALLAASLTAQAAGGATLDADTAASFAGEADGAEQVLRDRAAIGNYQALGDQAPHSPWSVVPVKSPVDGSTACIASIPLNFDTAKVVDTASGQVLDDEDKKKLHHNTGYIKVTESGPTFAAFAKTGFGAEPGNTAVTLDGAAAALTQLADDSYEIAQAVALTQTGTIKVTSTSGTSVPHTVEYNVTDTFPLQDFVDCNNKAASGKFDQEFAAIAPNTIAIISLPADEAEQAKLKAEYVAGGLCTKGFEAASHGVIQYSRTWLPSPIAAIARDDNGHYTGLAAGDLLKGTKNTFAKSIHLNQSPFEGSTISGCAGQARPICVEATEQDGKLTLSFCEQAVFSAFYNTTQPDAQITNIATGKLPSGGMFPPGTEWPGGEWPYIPGGKTPLVVVTPTDPTIPTNPTDPVTPVTPSPVPVSASIVFMGMALGSLGATAVGNTLRRRRTAAQAKARYTPVI